MNCMTLIDTGKYIGIFVTKRKSMTQYHARNFPTEGIFLDVAGQSIVNSPKIKSQHMFSTRVQRTLYNKITYIIKLDFSI